MLLIISYLKIYISQKVLVIVSSKCFGIVDLNPREYLVTFPFSFIESSINEQTIYLLKKRINRFICLRCSIICRYLVVVMNLIY
jgi:hypothetical protein